MSFISDYLFYNSGNEAPRNYHAFALMVVGASMLARRVWVPWKYFNTYPNLYVLNVGAQGLRKSTAKDIAKALHLEVQPTAQIAASVMSREAIVKYMAGDDNMQVYRDENGIMKEYHPLTFYINELKNFLSINPTGMIDFLTDIYDVRVFDARTIKHDLEVIPEPVLNILACETDEWIVDKLRMNVISGGFSRRFIYVVEYDEPARISDPKPPEGGLEALERVRDALKRLQTYAGPMRWHPDAWAWYDNWYTKLKLPEQAFLQGYYRSKHIQLQKIALINTLAETGEMLLTKDQLECALAMLDSIEPNIAALGAQVGKNPLAAPTFQLLRLLERGPLKEYIVRKKLYNFCLPKDYDTILDHLIRTKQVYSVILESERVLLCHRDAKKLNLTGGTPGKPVETGGGSASALTKP